MEDAPDPLLESVQNDIAQIGESLRTISRKVMEAGISEYPVFIAAQERVEIGRPITEIDMVTLNWFFNATILEDFVKREIVLPANLKNFQDTFGDPEERACVFVITPEEARFVFVPYDQDS